MAHKSTNGTILEELRNGEAVFELVSSPIASISHGIGRNYTLRTDNAHRFFARIGPAMYNMCTLGDLVEGDDIGSKAALDYSSIICKDHEREMSPALKKTESFKVQKVTGDGRCMFRALVKGMAINKGTTLSPREERDNADELRMAIKEVLCDNNKERHQYEEALVAITVEEPLKRYCQRIGRQDFWGGESELLVLSKLCRQPIIVYIPEHEHTKSGRGSGFIPIAEYGADFGKSSRKGKARKAVRLLYSGRNHYDLLV